MGNYSLDFMNQSANYYDLINNFYSMNAYFPMYYVLFIIFFVSFFASQVRKSDMEDSFLLSSFITFTSSLLLWGAQLLGNATVLTTASLLLGAVVLRLIRD